MALNTGSSSQAEGFWTRAFGRPPAEGTPDYKLFISEFVAALRAGMDQEPGEGKVVVIHGDLVPRARAFAEEVHAGGPRKGGGLPYFEAHLEPVAGLVRQSGGSSTQIAAAYLHDAAEDHGGRAMLDHIRAEFGQVMILLAECAATVPSDDSQARWRSDGCQRAEDFRHRFPLSDFWSRS